MQREWDIRGESMPQVYQSFRAGSAATISSPKIRTWGTQVLVVSFVGDLGHPPLEISQNQLSY